MLSTNDMAEAEHLSSRIAFLHNGLLYKVGTPAELQQKVDRRSMRITFRDAPAAVPDSLAGLAVDCCEDNVLAVHTGGSSDEISSILRAASDLGSIVDIDVRRPSLADIFREMNK